MNTSYHHPKSCPALSQAMAAVLETMLSFSYSFPERLVSEASLCGEGTVVAEYFLHVLCANFFCKMKSAPF